MNGSRYKDTNAPQDTGQDTGYDKWIDQDGDGFPRKQDCDDANPYVNPYADDIPYDGIDQDCDGEDLTDVDGDGFDAKDVGGDDCEDANSLIYPGAEEVCDRRDNDCDTFVDETCESMIDPANPGGLSFTCSATEQPHIDFFMLFFALAIPVVFRRKNNTFK